MHVEVMKGWRCEEHEDNCESKLVALVPGPQFTTSYQSFFQGAFFEVEPIGGVKEIERG